MAAQARAAAAWRACELSWAANEYSWARRAQRSCRSLALTPRPSIHQHSEAQAFVADELRRTDRLVHRRRLGAGEAQLVVQDEHPVPPLLDTGADKTVADSKETDSAVLMQYDRTISCWSSARAIHPLLESRGFLALSVTENRANVETFAPQYARWSCA